MTGTKVSFLAGLAADRCEALRIECTRIAELSDVELGARLLADTPTHDSRDPELLRRWAWVAGEFGTELAGRSDTRREAPPRIVERTGGLDELLLARYLSRHRTVELFTDTIALGEELIEMLGWRHWYPVGALRTAALTHEDAHHLLHESPATRRELRQRLAHPAARIGRWRITAHVAGADELAAHAYAAAAGALGRSPLLITAALTAAARALHRDLYDDIGSED